MQNKIYTLTVKAVENAKGKEKAYRLGDGGGLYLYIPVNGHKYWESRYKKPTTGKYTFFGLGTYPDVSLQEARTKAKEVRKLVDAGIDPILDREKKKREQQYNNANTLEVVARAWFEIKFIPRRDFEGGKA